MLAWLALCSVATVAGVACYLWWSSRRARALCAGLPGWPELPLLGNALQIYGDGETIFRRVLEISEACEKNNSMFQVWLVGHLCLIMSKPHEVKAVTNAFIDKPYYYLFAQEWVGHGLVTAPGEVWKRNIKKLAGSFTGSIVDGFQEVFDAQAQRLMEGLRGEVGKPPFDAMSKYLAYNTLEAICQTAMGMPEISQNIVTSEYYNAFNRTLELLILRGFNVLMHLDFIYRLTPAYWEYKRCLKVLHSVSKTVIRNRRKEWDAKKKKISLEQNDENPKKFKTFLDILLELSESDSSLTDAQIQAEVDTVIVGGQETTASTLQYALLMLGKHPEAQDKLYNELKEIFGDSSRPVSKEDLTKMKYCDAVLYETLRLFPPIPIVMRYSDRELQLDDKMTIPPNVACVVNVWGAGRSKRQWGEDAEVFRPERWLEESKVNSAAFLPFSYGRRSCIGKKYALALLKTILSQVLRELEIRAELGHLRFKLDVALRAIGGHHITVWPRNKGQQAEN